VASPEAGIQDPYEPLRAGCYIRAPKTKARIIRYELASHEQSNRLASVEWSSLVVQSTRNAISAAAEYS